MPRAARGPKTRLPKLLPGEMAITTDTEEFYVGGLNRNIKINGSSEQTNPSDLGIEVINVKQNGAKGDGSFDNTSIIQSAINTASANGGGVVYVPKGTYIINPLFMKPKVTLLGAGKGVTTLKYADTAPNGQDRVLTMHNNTAVLNLTIDGNWVNHQSGTEHMHNVFIYDYTNVLVDNCELINARADGVSVAGSTTKSSNITISNCFVKNNHRSDIVVEQVDNIKILNNTIVTTYGRPSIHFEPYEDVSFEGAVVTGNTIISNATNGEYCVALRGSGETTPFKGIIFANNFVDAPTSHILVGSVEDSQISDNTLFINNIEAWYYNRRLSITGNKIHAKSHGVYIHAESTDWTEDVIVSNNYIESPTMGVYLKGTKRVSITGNEFVGLTGCTHGVYVWAVGDTEDTLVSENQFKGFVTGVYSETYSTFVINGLKVIGNNFISLTDYGVQVKGLTNGLTVSLNTFRSCSGVYINAVANMNNLIISNNTMMGGPRGIYQVVSGSAVINGLVITNNIMQGLTYAGNGAAISGAAIELYEFQAAGSVLNVVISNNNLIGNAKNFIRIPSFLTYCAEGTLGDIAKYCGSGSPETVLTAPKASTYVDRTNGKLYVKETGTGNTGWIMK